MRLDKNRQTKAKMPLKKLKKMLFYSFFDERF